MKAFFARRGSSSREAGEAAATSLLQCLSDSFDPAAKRESASKLRQTLLDVPSAKSALSSFGLEIVCSTVRSDYGDEELVRDLLECLAIVVDSSYAESLAECRVNAEQLARTPGALSMLFDALQYQSFHVKYFALQILRGVFEANQGYCQQQSLRLQNVISGPLSLLGDQEVLRNEAILLLQCLVFKNKTAQDLAVRAGCLETTFQVVEGEDARLNYAVIEDALTLLRYVLENNLDSQAVFCSSPMFQRFLQTWQTRVSCSNVDISVEQSRILSSEMGVLFAFLGQLSVGGSGVGRLPKEIQAMLERESEQETSLLVRLLLSLVQIQGSLADYTFSASAWDCLLELSRHQQYAPDILGARIKIQNQLAPIQLGSMYIALTSKDAVHQMSCMRFCVRSLWKDRSMQDMCVKQLFSSANASSLLFGSTRTVPELLIRSRCLMCLAPLCLAPENRAKLQSIQHGAQQQQTLIQFTSSLLSKTILEFGKVPDAAEITVNATMFLACITQDSPDAVAAFLKSISERPFLVSVLVSHGQFGDNEGIIKGICSLLLGICMAAPASAGIDVHVLESTIQEKVGLSTFLGHINYLSEQTADFDARHLFNGVVPIDVFAAVSEPIKSRFYPGGGATEPVATPAVPPIVPPTVPPIAQQPSTQPPPTSNHSAAMFAPPPVPAAPIATQPAQYTHTYTHATQFPPTSFPSALETSQMSQTAQGTETSAAQPPAPATSQQELQGLVATVTEQKHQITQLTDKLNKTELDLEALSQAYTALDEHATKLQRQLDEIHRNQKASSPRNGLDEDAIEDLLVCLGQEEEKNKALEAEIERLHAERFP